MNNKGYHSLKSRDADFRALILSSKLSLEEASDAVHHPAHLCGGHSGQIRRLKALAVADDQSLVGLAKATRHNFPPPSFHLSLARARRYFQRYGGIKLMTPPETAWAR
jgi:hypothetical protein